VTQPRDAIIRVVDVDGEALQLTAQEQPAFEPCKHCGRGHYTRFRPTNFPNLLVEIAEAWARREWAKLKK
jgi:hypothetical protein